MRIKKGDLVEISFLTPDKTGPAQFKNLQEYSDSFFVVIKGPYESYRPAVRIGGKTYQSIVTLSVDLLITDQIIKAVPVDCLRKVEKI